MRQAQAQSAATAPGNGSAIAYNLAGIAVLALLVAVGAGYLVDRMSRAQTAPTGPVPAPALTTLLAFAEVVVAGDAIPGDGRDALQTWVQESAAEQPGRRTLCEAAAALLDGLAGGAFAGLSVAERTALVEKHRLAEHPVGRLELLSPRNRVAFAVRDLLVPELIRVYYDSPSGWAEVGYRRPYGECGQGREYTRVPT